VLLSVNIFVSLDGVVQGPGAPDEDRSGGFDRGGWLVPFSSPQTDEAVTGWFREADAFLFGRTSFGMLRGYWPNVTDPQSLIATQLNSLPKYVISSTLSGADADWPPTTVLGGDALEQVRRLKQQPGRELQVHGSWQLVQTLHEAGLVDLYRMLVYPVVVGTGKRLFPEGALAATFEISPDTSRVLPGGVTCLTLIPRSLGPLAAGSFVVEQGRSATILQ
jgi:dihydrofolate reductase